MNPLQSLVLAITLLVWTVSVATAQDLDDLDLTKGILALQCSDEGSLTTSLVFVQGDAGWVLSGSEDVVVTEIADGFRLTALADPNWMSLVTEEGRGEWKIRVLSETAISDTTCANIQDLVENLTATIAPRIAVNFSEIAKEVTDTTPALRDQIANLKQQNEVLEAENIELASRETFLTTRLNEFNQENMLLVDENVRLTAELNALKQLKGIPNLKVKLKIFEDSLDVLLKNPIQRMAFEIGAFMDEYGYEMSDQTASDYKFGYISSGNIYCLSAFEAGNLSTPTFCYELLQQALLPNTD